MYVCVCLVSLYACRSVPALIDSPLSPFLVPPQSFHHLPSCISKLIILCPLRNHRLRLWALVSETCNPARSISSDGDCKWVGSPLLHQLHRQHTLLNKYVPSGYCRKRGANSQTASSGWRLFRDTERTRTDETDKTVTSGGWEQPDTDLLQPFPVLFGREQLD